MRRYVSSTLLAAIALSGCNGTEAGPGPPPMGDAALQRAVDGFLATHRVPGASVAVRTGGRTITVVSGLADVERRRPVTRDTAFRIASITKNYVAALAMKLVEAREIDLDDPVERWLPSLPPHLAGARQATLEQLLSHTSGLPQTFTRDEDRRRTLGVVDLLDRIPQPKCKPGRCYLYGDGNYILVGLALEAAAGRPLNSELERRILRPLGLDDTVTSRPEIPAGAVAPQYHVRLDEQEKPVEPTEYLETMLPRTTGGIMATTASDLAAWGAALFGGRVLAPASLARMLDTSVSHGLPCPERCVFPYGLGVFHYRVAGRELVGHDGGSGAVLAHDVERDTTVAILTNGGEQNMKEILEAVLKALG